MFRSGTRFVLRARIHKASSGLPRREFRLVCYVCGLSMGASNASSRLVRVSLRLVGPGTARRRSEQRANLEASAVFVRSSASVIASHYLRARSRSACMPAMLRHRWNSVCLGVIGCSRNDFMQNTLACPPLRHASRCVVKPAIFGSSGRELVEWACRTTVRATTGCFVKWARSGPPQ